MAYSTSTQSEPVLIKWDHMRRLWIYTAGRISDREAEEVKAYLNTFVRNNPRFQFTVAQLYDEMYHVCITPSQSEDIRRQLETTFPLLNFPEANRNEVFPGSSIEKLSFRNSNDFYRFREQKLSERNKPIIRRKHQEARSHFIKVQNAFQLRGKQMKSILAFDIEVYEHNHEIMLEIGYVVAHFGQPTHNNLPNLEVTNPQHLIIRENLQWKNGDRVPDNRYGFKFGTSQTLLLREAIQKFREDIQGCDYILGHSVKHDDEYLKYIGVDLSVLRKEMFDTQVIQVYKESIKNSDKYFLQALPSLLKEWKLNYEEGHLHNGGCDAFYTLMVFLRQMGYSENTVNDVIAIKKKALIHC